MINMNGVMMCVNNTIVEILCLRDHVLITSLGSRKLKYIIEKYKYVLNFFEEVYLLYI